MATKNATTTPEATTATEATTAMDASVLIEALRAATSTCALASQINTNLNEIERLMLVK